MKVKEMENLPVIKTEVSFFGKQIPQLVVYL